MSFENYKKLLSEYVALKSISTDKAFVPEIQKTVSKLSDLFKNNGFMVDILKGPNSNPVVLASHTVSKDLETVLVYGHYDVQPAAKEDGWSSDPFTLSEKNGRLIGRGVVDNKGQFLIHVYTVLELIKQNKLKYNVKFLIEGNEETANEDMGKLIAKNKAKMTCDYVMISDGELASGRPVVEYSLRGGFNLTLKYTTAKTNLHSGIFGGTIPNAAFELSKFLSKLHDSKNKVTVPGFYEGVDKITKEQVASNKKLLKNKKEVFELSGAKALLMESGMDFYTQTGLRPTLQITGIKTGYIGDGYANIVPATAEARINFRTVRSQNEDKILSAFKKYVAKNTPKYVSYEISHTEPYKSVKVNINSEKVKEVKKLLAKAYEDEVLIKPVGGGIPVVSDFKDVLGKDTLLISLGNDDCNMHGVDENFNIELAKKGLKFSELFFSN